MKSVVACGTLAVGFLLLILSSLWISLFPATTTWTDEKATRSADVKARMAYLGNIVNSPTTRSPRGPDPQAAKKEFDALVIENQQLNDEFNSAAETPVVVSRVLKWSGISLAIIGLIGWYAVNQSR
jgi:hypothetical protein